MVMETYYLLEYSDNYCMRSGSLWNFHRDEINDDANENNDDNYRINNERQQQVNLFSIRQKILRNTTESSGSSLFFILKFITPHFQDILFYYRS